MLTQSLARTDDYAEGCCVITACAADVSARDAYLTVRRELTRVDDLHWAPWESLVVAVDTGQEEWKSSFTRRYLDFSPVAHLLADDDP